MTLVKSLVNFLHSNPSLDRGLKAQTEKLKDKMAVNFFLIWLQKLK
jgi:hypothetical protein